MVAGKEESISKIKDELERLTGSPLYEYRHQNEYLPVVGEGNLDARVVFIGEAPGKNEAVSGRPFCGRAGDFLNELLKGIGLNRSDVYITNIVNDRPPENRDPTPDEVELYGKFLDRQLDIISPKVIVTLGRFSMKYIMEKYGLHDKLEPISNIHGEIFTLDIPFGQMHIIPMYHPAAALYGNNAKIALEKDFNKVKPILVFGR